MNRKKAKEVNMKGKSYACRNKKENALRPGDYYATPKSLVWCAKDLFHKAISTDRLITEPCCGNGSISEALNDIGYGVIENDLFCSRKGIMHNDLLKSNLDEWCSPNVITNFPFSKWDDCVMAVLAKENLESLITIGRLNYLSTQSRLESPMWKHLKEMWCFSRYVDYQTEDRDDGKFFVGCMATAWFYFTKEEVEAPIIKFVDVQEYAALGNKKKEEEGK